ncbi:MAG: flagellar assembly protein A, partial [bacterium]
MSEDAREVIVTASTKNEAVIEGAQKLGRSTEEVDFSVIESGSRGFFGFFQEPWKLKVKPTEKHQTLKDASIEEAMKAAESVDGSFHLEVKNRNVYLTVYPPEGQGQTVQAESVIGHLNQVGLTFCDFDKVRSVVSEESGEPVQIGQLPPGEDIDTDYEVQISDDGLTAELTMRPPRLGGDPPSIEEIERLLNELKISEGVRWDVIEEMVENRLFNERRVIAEGRPPKKGEDGEIKYYFDTDNKPSFEDTEGKIDFREMGLINNVDEDEILAEKREPTPGRNGLTVQGESVEAPKGEDVELQYGDNVRQEENCLYSEISGQVILEDGEVSVYDVYTVEGDVDYSTGNIVFDGTVMVEGSVKDRFKIKA